MVLGEVVDGRKVMIGLIAGVVIFTASVASAGYLVGYVYGRLDGRRGRKR